MGTPIFAEFPVLEVGPMSPCNAPIGPWREARARSRALLQRQMAGSFRFAGWPVQDPKVIVWFAARFAIAQCELLRETAPRGKVYNLSASILHSRVTPGDPNLKPMDEVSLADPPNFLKKRTRKTTAVAGGFS